MDEARGELRTIQDVADELGITSRTLRFYEAKGLIEPRRVGAIRVYGRRELGRMQLILRGKRLGFSIKEIKEFLDLYDADPQHLEQLRRLAEAAERRREALEHQQAAIAQTIAELRQIEAEAMERLGPAAHPPRAGDLAAAS
ncbi:MerR family transcriptional regulator [Sphingomonas morindae]|uniref:MerR family DNA-binding protein n=1 Tax=Sphingomonas morindae TaxID=1541170 RepID=A0ABY4X4F7_9SPHN|nr:MerR family transcriptional regulator [Sphingomonas morindae]USI71730.1 MerR family DNA-binding protein [Sphingomonas morindae]